MVRSHDPLFWGSLCSTRSRPFCWCNAWLDCLIVSSSLIIESNWWLDSIQFRMMANFNIGWLQVPSENGEGADDSAESKQQMIPMLTFDDHLGDAYKRVQRIRAKRVTAWMDRRDTGPILIISSLLLSPLERLMPETQTYYYVAYCFVSWLIIDCSFLIELILNLEILRSRASIHHIT